MDTRDKLNQFYNDEELWQKLRDRAERDYNHAIVDFWGEYIDLDNNQSLDLEKFKIIYEKYIQDRAPRQLNLLGNSIGNQIYKDLQDKYDSWSKNSESFDQQEAMQLLKLSGNQFYNTLSPYMNELLNQKEKNIDDPELLKQEMNILTEDLRNYYVQNNLLEEGAAGRDFQKKCNAFQNTPTEECFNRIKTFLEERKNQLEPQDNEKKKKKPIKQGLFKNENEKEKKKKFTFKITKKKKKQKGQESEEKLIENFLNNLERSEHLKKLNPPSEEKSKKRYS